MANSTDGNLLARVDVLVADALVYRGVGADRDEALEHIVHGRRITAALPSYPFVLLMLGAESERVNTEDAAPGHFEPTSEVRMVIEFQADPAGSESERYDEAVDFCSGLIDDIWYRQQLDAVTEADRYPRLDSTRQDAEPQNPGESDPDATGLLNTDIFWAAYTLRFHSFQDLAVRRA